MPVTISKAKISLGDNVKGQCSSIVPRVLSKISMDMAGSFNILAFNDSISSLVRLTKLVLYHTMKLDTLV